MSHKTSYILWLAGLALTAALLVATLLTHITWLAVPSFVILLATVLQVSLFLCCPHCGKGLRVKGRRPKFCPECGEKIEW